MSCLADGVAVEARRRAVPPAFAATLRAAGWTVAARLSPAPPPAARPIGWMAANLSNPRDGPHTLPPFAQNPALDLSAAPAPNAPGDMRGHPATTATEARLGNYLRSRRRHADAPLATGVRELARLYRQFGAGGHSLASLGTVQAVLPI